jgi:hypothetical protein
MQVEMAARDGVRRSFPTSDWVEMAARDADSADTRDAFETRIGLKWLLEMPTVRGFPKRCRIQASLPKFGEIFLPSEEFFQCNVISHVRACTISQANEKCR